MQEAPSKMLGKPNAGEFVKLPQSTDKKKKKLKKPRVEIEFEMETDQPARQKIKK